MKTILLVSPYWKEDHRWMVSSVKLTQLWIQLGYEVTVVCMGSSNAIQQYDGFTVHQRKDWFIPDPWNYGIAFGFAGYVAKLTKKIRPDVVVINKLLFWSSLSTIALRFRGIRVIQLTDALVGMTWWPRGWFPQVCAAIYAWTLGWIELLCASRVVFFHPHPGNLLKRLGIAGKSEVIPTGINTEKFLLRSSALGMTDNIVVTYIGRLESIKGVDDFLAAAAPIAEKNPNVKLQVVGWYKEGHPLVAQYQRQVTFTGLQSDIPAILSKTDIFVLPSHSEGLSNALMEAMASGCACVASDVGGNRFLIQNGVSGFLFSVGDREALRSHIQRLIEDSVKRQTMGKSARERIEKVFSWEIVGKQYDQLFTSFISKQ